MTHRILDLHDDRPVRAGLLDVNNASARETSALTGDRFDQLIAAASVATFVPPDAAFLLAFAAHDSYDFQWFRNRFTRFLYVDRIVVAGAHRRHGLGRQLYLDAFARAERLGLPRVACEVNALPANPVSDAFHAAHGFCEVGRATFDDAAVGTKTVRYLLRGDAE
jgi:predicted GNAT superfamily acetyltransferase